MSTTNKPQRLGRGLNAIFDTEDIVISDKPISAKSNISEIELSKIEPNQSQPRQTFDQELINELAESIKSLGLIQPITLRENGDDKYTIISGERRFRASKLAGLTSVPAYVRSVDDNTMLEMALVENIQREELNSIEIAFTLNRLMEECGITQEQLAERVGKKRSTISNYIRLLKLPAEIQLSLNENLISMGHAKAIMSLEGTAQQIALLKRIVKHHLSVRQTEEMVKSMMEEKREKQKITDDEYPESYTRLVEYLEKFFSQEISIKKSAKGDGKIVIGFKNDDDVKEILSKFEKLQS
ncbi:MAG: ParB/RepB/Spo0J family partition protein [Rikenellaceae bacterium]